MKIPPIIKIRPVIWCFSRWLTFIASPPRVTAATQLDHLDFETSYIHLAKLQCFQWGFFLVLTKPGRVCNKLPLKKKLIERLLMRTGWHFHIQKQQQNFCSAPWCIVGCYATVTVAPFASTGGVRPLLPGLTSGKNLTGLL